MQKEYAQAIDRLIARGVSEGDVVKNLVAHLKRSGRTKLLPGIKRELEQMHKRMNALSPKVEVAHERDASSALKAAKEMGIEANKAEVNKSLLSGWRARSRSTLVDRSGKRALVDLYRKITDA